MVDWGSHDLIEANDQSNTTRSGYNIFEDEKYEGHVGVIAHDNEDVWILPRNSALVPVCTAAVSLLASYVVLREVVHEHCTGRGQPIYRILMAMAVSDIVFSLGYGLSTFAAPSDLDYLWGNVGTRATCTMQGFFVQFGLMASPWWSAALAYFYLLTIRYGYTNRQLARLEPHLHLVIWSFALVASLIPIPLGLYNNAWEVCWIHSYPQNCESYGTCTRGQYASSLAVGFSILPVWPCMLLSLLCLCMIYSFVLTMEAENVEYGTDLRRQHADLYNDKKDDEEDEESFSARRMNLPNIEIQQRLSRQQSPLRIERAVASTPDGDSDDGLLPNSGTMGSSNSMLTTEDTISSANVAEQQQQQQQQNNEDDYATIQQQQSRHHQPSSHMTSLSSSSIDSNRAVSRGAAQQAFLYTVAFFCSYSLSASCVIAWRGFHWENHWLTFFAFNVGEPLGGFWKALVFIRAREMKTWEGKVFCNILGGCCFGRSGRQPSDTGKVHPPQR